MIKRPIRYVTGTLKLPAKPAPPVEEPELPPHMEQIKNVGKSLISGMKQVLAGKEIKVEEEEAKKRLDICGRCEFFRKSDERCSKCGCYMAVKTYLKAERCPEGRW